MKDILSRRSILAGIGHTAACGSVASQLLSVARAAESAAPAAAPAAGPETILSMIFMDGPKNKFDAKKYAAKHLPLLKKSYGDSVSRIELRTSVGAARNLPSDILATTTIYIANLAEFIPRMQGAAAEVSKNLDESSTGTRNIQVDRVAAAVGDSRAEVRASSQVFCTFYKDQAGATFDAAYYTDVYIPKLRSLYGDNAIRRIELHVGVPQGGARPAIVAASHIFMREREAFGNADQSNLAEMMKLDPNYTNTTQMWADLKVIEIV